MEKTPGNGTKEGGWHDGAEAAGTGSKRLCGGHQRLAGRPDAGRRHGAVCSGPARRCLAPEGPASPPGLFLLAARPAPAEKNRAAPHLCGAVLSGCAGRRTGFRGFRKGAAQRAVFFSSGASGLFSRFSSGISSLLMMVSICSSFFTSSLGKRLFTRWTTVLR